MDWHHLPLLGLGVIRTVRDTDDGVPYRTVPLAVAVTVTFGLLSIIGAQQTIIWTAQHEREQLARTVSLDTDAKIERGISADRAVTALHFATLDQEVRALRERMDAAQKQLDINTGHLGQGGAWRNR